MKSSIIPLALGIVAIAAVLAVKHVPRPDSEVDQPELDSLRQRGAI